MDLKSGYPYFLLRTGLRQCYSTLRSNYNTDVIVIGGGISGALAAYYLKVQGISCCVADGRSIGLGSTCASTSLIQYELDVPLFKLKEKIGWENARMAYWLSYKAIDKIKHVSEIIGYDEYTNCYSVYFAHRTTAVPKLKEEYAARKKAGFAVELIEDSNLVPARSPAAILNAKAAKIDAYLFTHYLHKYNMQNRVPVFENTRVLAFKRKGTRWILKTKNGYTITAKKIIFASGYEAAKQLPAQLVKLMSTYAVISKKKQNTT